MSKSQKIIKYFAIILAIGIIINIFGVIAQVVIAINSSVNYKSNDTSFFVDIAGNYDTKILDIEVSTCNLEIKAGEEFKLETNNKHLKSKQDGDKLYVKEESYSFFKRNRKTNLVIYVPDSLVFDNVYIENGAGTIDVDTLKTNALNLNLGAGKVYIDNLVVRDETNIDGGAGQITIDNSSLNNLDLDMGVGKFTINASLQGKNKISAGVGELKLNLLDGLNNYKIKVDKGIGSCKLNGSNMTDDTYYGNGRNIIEIDGGVGSINVNTLNTNNNKEFTRTYTVLNKVEGMEEHSWYLTLQVFQGEVDTVLVKDFNYNVEVDKTYEFKFEKNYDILNDNIKEIFNNSKLIEVLETDKEGLNQVNEAL